MWATLSGFISKIITALVPLFLAKRLGESKARNRQLEADAEARKEDEEIASRPPVRNPFGRMRNSKSK
jgi:hypothetical protein